VLCANHPSEYLYDTNLHLSDALKNNGKYPAPISVMCQDLVAAGWQAHMSEHPGDDPHKTLGCLQERWGWDAKQGKVKADKIDDVLAIMKQQNQEFSWGKDTFIPTAEQSSATIFTLSRSSETDTYASYAFDAKGKSSFSAVMMNENARFNTTQRLMQVGGYVLEWSPPTAQEQEIHYRLFNFDRNSANPLAEKTVGYGCWKKDKFFGDYRPNFGASFEQIELIAFPGYVLSIIPAVGRRTYQLWNFDPQAENDCLSAGEFQQGGFRDISAGSELHVLGNYVLERSGADYKVWSFDPQSSPPLALPTVQSGSWSNIDEDDSMMTLGEWVLTWKPNNIQAGCRIWQFDAHQADPLGGEPLNTSALPVDFDQHSSLFSVIPAAPQDASAQSTPGTLAFMQDKIEHVVYYMLESRSFDNVLGWLYERGKKDGLNWVGGNKDGFRGLDAEMHNKMPDGKEAFIRKYQAGKLSNDFVLGGPAQDPWHDNSDGLMQMFHGYKGYEAREKPKMGPEQLSVFNGLAKHFAVSDEWFSSLPGGTDVNRGFSVSGSAYNRLGTWEGSQAYANWPDSAHRQSIWNALWSHGQQDWKIYYNILWQKAVFTHQLYLKGQIPEVDAAWAKAVLESKYNELPTSKWIAPFDQFLKDINEDNLPSFSYIEPAWMGVVCTSYHPGSSADGIDSLVPAEQALNQLYEALSSNKDIWDKTLLVVTFDKNGGLFDHVAPPYAPKPWPNDEVDGFEFDIMGPRVPAVFASPWIKPNTVLRADDDQVFDATSFGATLLDWYGIDRSGWGLGDRMSQAPTFETVFTQTSARTSAPKMTVPYDKDHQKKG